MANGVIQPLTNFLLNDLTRVQQRKTTFQAAGKGAITIHVDQSHGANLPIMRYCTQNMKKLQRSLVECLKLGKQKE